MAYLYKHTPLQQTSTSTSPASCPTENRGGRRRRARLDLASDAAHFLDFRSRSVTRRFEFELARAASAASTSSRASRRSSTRSTRRSASSARPTARRTPPQKLMKRFELDDVQADAILELKLYKLARLEIQVILEELAEKQREAKEHRELLKTTSASCWSVVRDELAELGRAITPTSAARRSAAAAARSVEFDAEAFIVDEDATVVLSRDGWVKRVREVKDPSATRLREGDAVMAARARARRRSRSLLLELRQRLRHAHQRRAGLDRLRRPGAEALQVRATASGWSARCRSTRGRRAQGDAARCGHASDGFGLRFALDAHRELSTRAGRRFAKPGRGRRDRRRGDRRARTTSLCVVDRATRALWSARSTRCPSWRVPAAASR